MVGAAQTAELCACLGRELGALFARVAGRLGEQRGFGFIEAAQFVPRAVARFDGDAGGDQGVDGERRLRDRRHARRFHQHTADAVVAERLVLLRVFAREQVLDLERADLDLLVLEACAFEEGDDALAIAGQRLLYVAEAVAGAAEGQCPGGVVALDAALGEPLHGDGAVGHAEALEAVADRVACRHETEGKQQRGQQDSRQPGILGGGGV